MFQVLGSTKQLCNGLTRREVLSVGTLAAGGLTLPQILAGTSSAAGELAHLSTFGQAKRVILLYLAGAASQLETFDPKPDAPAEVRGEHLAIETALPGVWIDEHLPRIAGIMDRLTLIRSMSHSNNNHSNLFTLTGQPAADFGRETQPLDSRHHPFFGSVLDYLEDRAHPQAPPPTIPRNFALPYQFSKFNPFFRRSGPYGGFLGRGYDPVFSEFVGKASTKITRTETFGVGTREVQDPFLGIEPDSRFLVSSAAEPRQGLTVDRLNTRRSLLEQLDEQRRAFDASRAGDSVDRHMQMAWSLLGSAKVRQALDIAQESPATRERYGMNLFGQAVLAGRRLLEAGGRVVTVFWDEYQITNTAWDTHFDHYSRLQQELLPGLDLALPALIVDLAERGLLDDTLVLCLTEHGRAPKISKMSYTVGRDHWSNAYCNLLAGAGIKRGHVHGSTDAQAAFVTEHPVDPRDVLCTIYHLLGVDPHTTIRDRQNRPVPLVAEGRVLHELLG